MFVCVVFVQSEDRRFPHCAVLNGTRHNGSFTDCFISSCLSYISAGADMNDTTHKEAYVRDVLIPGMVARGQLSFTEPVPAGVKTRLKSVEVKPLVTNGFMLTIPFVVTVVLEREGSAQGKEAPEPETLHLIVKVSVKIGGTTRRHFACKF